MWWIALIPIILLLFAFFLGRSIERSHFASIAAREVQYADIMMTDLRTFPDGSQPSDGALVTGATVVATDYFKSFAASIRNIFGGEVRGVERMIERGRRESILRMLAEARATGANAVYNVRIDTSTITGKKAGAVAGVEVLVSGTAVKNVP